MMGKNRALQRRREYKRNSGVLAGSIRVLQKPLVGSALIERVRHLVFLQFVPSHFHIQASRVPAPMALQEMLP